jgi:hypothetical protein
MLRQSVLTPVLFAIVGWAALVDGCGSGDGLPRQRVEGNVVFDSQPLAEGTIQFQPDASIQGPAVPGGASITGGTYRISPAEGLVPGRYKVMIFAHTATRDEASAAPGARTGPPPELIPAKYNVATTLTAEVVKDKPNIIDFDLKK